MKIQPESKDIDLYVSSKKMTKKEREELAQFIEQVKEKRLKSNLPSNQKTSKAQYNKEIDAALERVKNGKSISNNDVMNEMIKW